MSPMILLLVGGGVSAAIGTILAVLTHPQAGKGQLRLPLKSKQQTPQRFRIVVRIVDKRFQTVTKLNHSRNAYSNTAGQDIIYYMTFEAQDGTQTEMEIPEAIFCGCLAGFVGSLTYEVSESGLRFIDFDRDRRYRVNGL